MKNILIGVGVIIVVGVLYYFISPLFISKEVQDELPEGVVSGFEELSPERQAEMLSLMEDINAMQEPEMADDMPSANLVSESTPVMGTRGHPAEGTVRVIETEEGTIIRFEDFDTINGPRLHLYLSKDLEADEFIDLGPIRGTSGNINYTVPDGVDLSEYRYVMHWCVPFSVLFNYADLGV